MFAIILTNFLICVAKIYLSLLRKKNQCIAISFAIKFMLLEAEDPLSSSKIMPRITPIQQLVEKL